MTIEELKLERQKLEGAISKAIKDFEEKTGLHIKLEICNADSGLKFAIAHILL